MDTGKPDATEPPVLVHEDGHAGRIMLNRPASLNTLTLEMVRLIDAGLDRFEADPGISLVLLEGAGDRAFCAGGDVRSIYDAILNGDPMPLTFWAEEYRLNARIARFGKPIVAVMDRIVMGGGVGLASHASHRVVTDRSVVAMPEASIGFAPDVGGTWLLTRGPGEAGTYIGLTSSRLNAADAIYAGLADYYVAGETLPELLADLTAEDPTEVLKAAASDAPAGDLPIWRSWIDRCYSAESVEEILERLLDSKETVAVAAAHQMQSKSPTSLKVTLRALRTARHLPSLEDCLKMEYLMASRFLDTPDYLEGVRAVLVDKDHAPRWKPARLQDVTDTDVGKYFETD